MAAAGTRSAAEKLSLPPVILLSSSSGGDSDDYSAASDPYSDMGGEREIDPLLTKRQRKEVISGGSSPNGELLSDGFLDPLPPPKPFKVSPMLSGKKGEHTTWNDTKKCFLLKLLEDYNEPKWRKQDKWVFGVWERILQDFKNRFRNANVNKSQLQDRAYKMKKTYKLLKKLSETSCLRWNHTSNMLQGPEYAWRTLIRTNKTAKQWYNKPWPFYSICQRLFEGNSVVENQSTVSKDCKESEPISQQFVELQEIDEVSEQQMHPWSDLDDSSCQISFQKKYKPSQMPSIGKSVVENQSSGLNDCKENVTTPLHVKTSQQLVELQDIEEIIIHSGSDFDDPTSQISSQKKDGTFQVTCGSFTTSTGKPSSNLKLTREFTDMRSEREFSIKICMEAFYKLDGFTREDVLKVGRVFKIMENREIFLSLRDDDKELWLRGEMDAFQF